MNIRPLLLHTSNTSTITDQPAGPRIDKALVATDAGTDFTTLDAALAAAGVMTAGAAPGVAIVQVGSGFKLLRADVVTTTTPRDAARPATTHVAPFTAASFDPAVELIGLDFDARLTLVDGELILHPARTRARWPLTLVPGPAPIA